MLVTVKLTELGTQNVALVKTRPAIYAEQNLGRTARMQVMLYHEIQELPVAFTDLIHEFRESYAARDQTLASLTRLKFTKTAACMPDYDSGSNILYSQTLLRHYGPFLAPQGESIPRFSVNLPKTPESELDS